MSEPQVLGLVFGGAAVLVLTFLLGNWAGSQEAKSYKTLEGIATSWRDKALKLDAKVRKLKKQLRRIAKDL